jgi:nucleolar GTP-binding protein
LFVGKPLLIVATKSDIITFEKLSKENRELIQSILVDGTELVSLSNITEDGISSVKSKACDKLLEHRVETKLSKGSDKVDSILARIHLSQPEKRDDKQRPAFIPQSVLDKEENMEEEGEERVTEKTLSDLNGGAGVYQPDLKKRYLLKDDDWKYDKIPEIWQGKNIADFIDPDILEKLGKLEEEELRRLEEDEGINWLDEEFYVDPEDQKKFDIIGEKSSIYRKMKHVNSSTNSSKIPRKFRPIPLQDIEKELKLRGVDDEILDRAKETTRSMSRGRTSSVKSRSRSASEARILLDAESRDQGVKETITGKKRKRSLSTNSRSLSTTGKFSGIMDPRQQIKAVELGRKKQKIMNQNAKKGEGDRVIPDLMPKHLYTGKRSNGKNERR